MGKVLGMGHTANPWRPTLAIGKVDPGSQPIISKAVADDSPQWAVITRGGAKTARAILAPCRRGMWWLAATMGAIESRLRRVSDDSPRC